jgi:endonuclease III
MDAATIVR